MTITGAMLLGSSVVAGQGEPIQAINPATGKELEPTFYSASEADVGKACALAAAAFDAYRETSLEQRAQFLEAIATNIEALGDALVQRATAETGLPAARIQGETGRTIGQLRLFAEVVRAGDWLGARVDEADAQRQPPRPDLRLRHIPLGPVAVFGASNFPLAFSVAGGDTASALAAGAPVVVKAHSAHPGTSELVGRAVQKAVADCGMPEGVFSMLLGPGRTIGTALVADSRIKAVGFTGSRSGGQALMRVAASRPEPIPVYAEMSSINPVFLFPEAVKFNSASLAEGFVSSLAMGAGQFCTNPGLVIAMDDAATQGFIAHAAHLLEAQACQTMLTPGIHEAYERGVMRLLDNPRVKLVARGKSGTGINACRAALFVTSAVDFLADATLSEEVFGSSTIVVKCETLAQYVQLAMKLEGQLTATVHMHEQDDSSKAQQLVRTLELKAGRVLFNGFPTGVEVGHAMVHGGPFPATSDGRSTSVGSAAIFRFLRPVCYQNVPEQFLPEALVNGNPLGIRRMINGKHE